jgi:serine/threonine protein phosphatase 1
VSLRRLAERLGLYPRQPVQPKVPAHTRVYCVGDVHGREDLLKDLCRRIRHDADGFDGERVAVFLGDYVDRGPASRGVVECLMNDPLPGFRSVFLRGNHEQAMLHFLEQPAIGEMWLTFGGHATLMSYGVALDRLPSHPADFMRLSEQLRESTPLTHWQFLRETPLSFSIGNYFFCHAGIRPGVALAKQAAEDLLWIREEFTQSTRHHEKIVVHGHTVSEEVELLPNRIGLDTGAYDSGILSCLVLEGDTQRVIQTL